MDTKHLPTALDLKAVDAAGRTLEGYAAVFGNLDRTGDIINAKAFDRTLAENPDVQVFVGHRADTLPVGEAFDIRPDATGLFTRVKVYATPDGDALLEVARQRMAAGKSLGMSIGYRTVKERFDARTKARHLLDVDLVEFSYLASPALAANPRAMVTAMKRDATYAQLEADLLEQIKAGSMTLGEAKAELDAAARDRLDPEQFAFVDASGDGHLPINNADHVRAAMGRFNQTQFPDPATRKRAARNILAAAERHGMDVAEDSDVAQAAKSWEQGGVAALMSGLSAKLADLAAEILETQRAMDRLGTDVKNGQRLTAPLCAQIKAHADTLSSVLSVAAAIDAGEDGKLRVDWYRHNLRLQELMEEVA